MIANLSIKNLIREGKIHQLPSIIQTHHDIGMVSLDESLAELYNREIITFQTVRDFCNDHDEVVKNHKQC